ncbi:MAG: hypothetical protein H6742_00085 [Alphaproteobacteria bacterium]|nr:hypothetical protein [Alphaproteobacteria bacterium]
MRKLSLALLLALPLAGLTLSPQAHAADQCDDGLDNDEDGWTDEADPDCILGGDTELGFGGDECNDDVDNDDDGYVDADDPDCQSATDPEGDGSGNTDSGTDTDTDTDSDTATDGDTDSDSATSDSGGTDTFFDEGEKLSEATDEKGGFGCVGNSAFLLLLPIPLLFRRKRCCADA